MYRCCVLFVGGGEAGWGGGGGGGGGWTARSTWKDKILEQINSWCIVDFSSDIFLVLLPLRMT